MTIGIFITIVIYFYYISEQDFHICTPSNTSKYKSYESCDFMRPNPFEPAVLKHVNESYVPECSSEWKIVTELIDGQLIIESEVFLAYGTWSYRCILNYNETNYSTTKWKKIISSSHTIINCEAVEVRAIKNYQPTYGYVHYQVIRKTEPRLLSMEAPSVHVIVIDSVSHPNLVRSFKKTNNILRDKYNAVYFPYLNKIGANSIPNSWPMFFGHEHEHQVETLWGPARAPEWMNFSKPMNDFFIMKQFTEKSYVTMLNEDHEISITCYFGCVGLVNPADHGLAGFRLRQRVYDHDSPDYYYNKQLNITYIDHIKKCCRESHLQLLDHLQRFIDVYLAEAQFSITWMSNLVHENMNSLFHADNDFAGFFDQNSEKLKNSFVILMADHGTRFGEVQTEPIAQYEDYNPAFVMIVPETYRQNSEFMKVLNSNSEKLFSHHDVFATLYDIVTNHNKVKKDVTKPKHLFRSSLLQPLLEPRNCFSLGVPLKFCMCKKVIKVTENSDIAIDIAHTAVDRMNQALKENGHDKKCLKLSLHKESKVNVAEYNTKWFDGETMIYVTFRTWPNMGLYSAEALVYPNRTYTITTALFPRINSFLWQTRCLDRIMHRDYCYCKQAAVEDGFLKLNGATLEPIVDHV
ncbi:unnamed protein product [Bursaphelenchus okinawaensis]|uniref:Sulfatase domain-containing protein n=1 Tax=Bursaphelenchus okinawaensis TaxID=465554 RepID=A0A811L5N7_9BILA|nr:unnamed protein product [Bursaphelenchus okinawaensis]CAG9117172.1 unnamed protein product [Bursaphelenchus okinawaensis]